MIEELGSGVHQASGTNQDLPPLLFYSFPAQKLPSSSHVHLLLLPASGGQCSTSVILFFPYAIFSEYENFQFYSSSFISLFFLRTHTYSHICTQTEKDEKYCWPEVLQVLHFLDTWNRTDCPFPPQSHVFLSRNHVLWTFIPVHIKDWDSIFDIITQAAYNVSNWKYQIEKRYINFITCLWDKWLSTVSNFQSQLKQILHIF